MKNILPSASALIGLILGGCAAKTGHTFLEDMPDSEAAHVLVAHVTTKEQVKGRFGDPEEIDIESNGGEKWTYSFKRSEAKGVNYVPIINSFYRGTNDTIKRLKILFTPQGRVEKYAFSSSQGETQLGVFQ